MRNPFSRNGFFEMLAVTVAAVSVLLIAVWQLASEPAASSGELQRDVDFLSAELKSVKERLDRSQAREAVLEREADVLRQANRLLREQESDRQATRNTMQSELDFYRRLAGTGGAQTGLDIYRTELVTTGSERVYQFVLTLTQNIRRAAIITGRARIDVEGTLEDRLVTLPWSQLASGDEPEPTFRFKYFQQLDGYIALPESFSPTRLVVTLEAKGSRNPVQRSFDWSVLLAESAD